MTPDVVYDQLIGMGRARRLTFSYGGNPGVGSLHRFRDAVEHGWPRELEVVEHSHAGLAAAYAAGAARLPFGVLAATRAPTCRRERFRRLRREPVRRRARERGPAINPDVAVIHAQHADRRGNVMLWGLAGVQKEAVLAARSGRSSPSRRWWTSSCARPHSVFLPAGSSTPWSSSPEAPGRRTRTATRCGTTPSMPSGTRSPATGKRFAAWMRENVLEAA